MADKEKKKGILDWLLGPGKLGSTITEKMEDMIEKKSTPDEDVPKKKKKDAKKRALMVIIQRHGKAFK